MKFARIVFLIAGVYGILVTLPLFFMEEKFNVEYPPVLTHPEYYYSFAGIVLVCQFLFLIIALNPVRYRSMMMFGVFEKLSLVPAFVILFPQGRFPSHWIPLIIIDAILCVLFFISFLKALPEKAPSP